MKYKLVICYQDGSQHVHESSNPYELDMNASFMKIKPVFSVSFLVNGQYVAGLCDWTRMPKDSE